MCVVSSIRQFIKEEKILPPKASILIAISGGSDSVALTHILLELGYDVHLGHVNFGLRGEESNSDEAFVDKLARNLKLPLHIKRVSNIQNTSVQLEARNLRYTWLESIRKKHRLSAIATGHHQDDHIETILYRLFARGTGLKGLQGIPVKRDYIIRPLLNTPKKMLLHFLKGKKCVWQKDSTNATSTYDRNWIRNELIPLIEVRFPLWKENIKSTAGIWKESQTIVQEHFNRFIKKKVLLKNQEQCFPILWLKNTNYTQSILWEYLSKRNFSSAQVIDVIKLMDAQSGKWVASSSHRIYKHGKWLKLSPLPKLGEKNPQLITQYGACQTALGTLSIKQVERVNEKRVKTKNMHSVCIDAKHIQFPLLLRPWKSSDYFYPLGIKKKKKISRFLIDRKCSLSEKENTYVLEYNGKILWIVGHQIDERFKVKANTSIVYQLEWVV